MRRRNHTPTHEKCTAPLVATQIFTPKHQNNKSVCEKEHAFLPIVNTDLYSINICVAYIFYHFLSFFSIDSRKKNEFPNGFCLYDQKQQTKVVHYKQPLL